MADTLTQIPDRGDIVLMNFSPQSGREQSGFRPGLVVSPSAYHGVSNYIWVCPITSNTSPWPWKVILDDATDIQGAVLVDQMRSLDRVSRKCIIKERVSDAVIQSVLSKIATLGQ